MSSVCLIPTCLCSVIQLYIHQKRQKEKLNVKIAYYKDNLLKCKEVKCYLIA